MKAWTAAVACMLLAGTTQAALINRGGGMIYDSVRNITWLADMNYAKTSGYSSSGEMSWSEANTWATQLVHGGYDDWRLPTINPADLSGELSGLFVTDLGNKQGESVLEQAGDSAEQIVNLALFSNVQSWGYWSGTANAGYAWFFAADAGTQSSDQQTMSSYAVAVRPGDSVAPVPEPSAMMLTLLGLSLTPLLRRRWRSDGRHGRLRGSG